MKFGVVVLPGSNCDHDALHVAEKVLGAEIVTLWHKESDIRNVDCVILPGGFAYGDYLRAGALAKFAPIIESVKRHAAKGGLVLGICNGFQVLTEVGLLPGALMRNSGLSFICRDIRVRVEHSDTPFTSTIAPGTVLRMPIAHGEGNYIADERTLEKLESNNQVILRYCSEEGDLTADANPNGSARSIAGICNESRNVFGLMPHPERCSESLLGNQDGLTIFRSIEKTIIGLGPDRQTRVSVLH
ncbi:MAG TPA: phosphoribosylformylglycinamidine synthase subunit PurQ [Thermoanaerobaculia bacterium]|nr:phosphoribosylformylglycinamidine synthase subunit PurQ [Thermoanaerobaculia bacterium]